MPWDLDLYSREYFIKIEEAATLRDLVDIREQMIKEYCLLARQEHSPKYSPLVQQMADLIEARFCDNLTLVELSEIMGHNANYMSVKFRQETGTTFSEYLNDIRISHAKKMLEETNLPVSTIAEECGIPDNNYFARIFKQHVGMTPTKFRG